MPKPPRVYISYSWGVPEHMKQVRALADRLRDEGIESHIDQYYFDSPPNDWLEWQAEQVRDADFVLLVCTERYKNRIENVPQSGAYRDGQHMVQELTSGRSTRDTFIPVGYGHYNDNLGYVPAFISGAHY